jgi:hypothetical protein
MPSGEVHYFDTNYDKKLGWYKRFFEKANKNDIVGEKTPTYMYYKDIPNKIFEINPKMKIIFLLRDPIERAYSHYWHHRKAGRLQKSFEELIKNEEENHYIKECIEYSKYLEPIKNFKKIFPGEQILVLKSNELKNNREKILKQVHKFLGIREVIPKNIEQEYNVGKLSRSQFLTKAIKKFQVIRNKKNPLTYVIGLISMWNQKKFLERFLRPSKFYTELKVKKDKTYPQIDKKTQKLLEEILETEMNFWKEIK